MAQHMVLRRLLAPIFSRKFPQCCPVPLVPEVLAHGSSSRPSAATPSLTGWFSTTKISNIMFNVQDVPDFQDKVVNSETPVVVDFHAQWCGPCKILEPWLEKMVEKQGAKLLMAKVGTDDTTNLAIEYEVPAVPTVLAIKNRDVVHKFVGIKDEDQLESFLMKLIGCRATPAFVFPRAPTCLAPIGPFCVLR
ncbi:LOW QUALITY PROTEIN: thioredoxin, mitochondrial-like [Dromiciops gliroides]|uniref:LOW QUALITY PROTEIN: thioredoxin, mitochondrial-like n=1 Tax=Dromiciops gliroides TaxID=33562 RepID=UPI001CC7ADEF|nr:LOW QUALITY PROTEIN: thioredoxin, mitochondrial-like [Dromiciops gliroides]